MEQIVYQLFQLVAVLDLGCPYLDVAGTIILLVKRENNIRLELANINSFCMLSALCFRLSHPSLRASCEIFSVKLYEVLQFFDQTLYMCLLDYLRTHHIYMFLVRHSVLPSEGHYAGTPGSG